MEQGYEEILRTIRYVDPSKPSTRVSETGEARVPGRRALTRGLRGELDWIVMKALEKNRARRYETANGFALDIQRYLSDEPVVAGPPSRLYRFRKYVKRHRLGVSAASIVIAALVTGVVLAFSDYVKAAGQRDLVETSHRQATRDAAVAERAQALETEQRALAEDEEKVARKEAAKANTVLKLIKQMLSSADPHEVKGMNYTVRQLLEDFDRDLEVQLEAQPEVEATVRTTMGRAYLGLGLHDKAEPQLRKALAFRQDLFGDDHPAVAASRDNLARATLD